MLKVFPSSTGAGDSLLGLGLGALPYATGDTVTQRVNGDWCLKLSYPSNKPGAALLENGNLILSEGQLYRIRRVKRADEGAKQIIEIEAPHVAFDLQNYCIENIETDADDQTLDGITAEQALTQLLQNTPFSVGTVDVPSSHLDYLDILQKDVMRCLQDELLKKWGGELVFDNWTVHLRIQCGAARDYPIRQGKNITAIRCTEDLSETVTRLHIIGYGGADVKDVNGGLDYIDSPYIHHYPHPMEGYVTFSDEDDPAALLQMGQKHLATVDVPKVSFDISLARLKDSPQYKFYSALETFELGDTALLHHDMLNADIALRCVERTFSASTGVNTSVKLGNTDETIASALSAAKSAQKAIQQIMTATGRLRANKLEGVIDALKACLYASAEYQTAEVKENQGILLENNQVGSASYGAMYMGPGIFAIANEKDGTGAWSWRTFGSGAGFSADQITAGTLSAARLDVQNLDLSANVTLLEKLAALPKGIRQSAEAPENPADGELWLDISEEPIKLKRYNVTTDAQTGAVTAGWETVSDMATLQGLLDGLRADYMALQSTSSGLTAEIAAVSGAAETLKGQQAALSNGLLAINEDITRMATKEELEAEEAARAAAIAGATAKIATVETHLTDLSARAGEISLTLQKTVETVGEHGATLDTYNQNFTFDANGLTIGRAGSTAKFRASNAEMSVKNGLFEAVAFGRNEQKEWIIVASQSGLGIKHV